MSKSKWFGFNVTHQFIIIWLSLASFLHNVLMNGANNVIISSLQKEFYLSSKETGAYVSIYDVGSLVSAVTIPFLTAHGSKAKWISFGMLMLFLGCQVTVLPHFFRTNPTTDLPSSEGTDGTVEICNNSHYKPVIMRSFATSINMTDETTTAAFVKKPIFQLKHLLYLGNTINGLSSASMTSVAFSYIEDIAPHKRSAIYESIYYASGALGMGVGFIVTSYFLLFHTDFNLPNNVLPDWLKPNHPNWIGAWWLPFIVFGFVSLLLGAVMFFFPSKLDTDDIDDQSQDTDKEFSKDDLKNMSELVKLNPDENKEKNEKTEEKTNHLKQNMNIELRDTLEFTGSMLSITNKGADDLKLSNEALNDEGYLGLLKKTALLFKNPVFVFLLIAQTIEGMLQNSFLAFASLFLEYQYRIASGTSALLIGVLSLPPLICGSLVSGYICKKLKNDTVECFKLIVGVLFVNVIVYSGFLIYCQEPTLVSNTNQDSLASIFQENVNSNLSQTCYKTASNCNCDTKIFKPICLTGSKDIYFQSPCLAGCRNYTKSDSENFYSDCTQSQCAHYFENPLEYSGHFVDGLCPSQNCTIKLITTYVCIFLLMLLNALLFLPYLKVTIGSVDSKEMNTIGLGLKQFFMNALGTIPGPILFGTVIDASCNYWHTDSQGQKVCKMYNNQVFARNFGSLGMGFKAICFILMLISLIISMRRRRNSTT